LTLDSTAGSPTADSYFSLEEATAYFTARGVAAWAGAANDTIREQVARKATSYLDNAYRKLWRGFRTEKAQRLAWPRNGLIDEDGFEIAPNEIPRQVKEAAMEAALLVLSGSSLEPVLDRGGQIKSISKGVGPLQKSITYMDGASNLPRYTVLDGLLSALVKSAPGASSGNVSLVRG